MASGRLLLAATLTLSGCFILPTYVRADESGQTDSDARHVFQGEVNANAVFVRSRASEDAYPTMKLAKGATVTVVGIKGQWLKIEPPEGSFAYVAKSFINLRGDGTVGRATRDTLAHAGSQLNDLLIVTMATVHEGDDVQIIGQYNEYFKIKPPKDSYVWINKQFVDPIKTVAPQPAPQPLADDTHPQPAQTQPSVTAEAPASTKTPVQTASNDTAKPATTQPVQIDAMGEFDKLEKQFVAINIQPLGEQPLPELLAGYQKLIAADALPTSMRQIAEIRVATLKVRNDARTKFLAVEDNEKKMAEKQKSLVAERQEIEARIKKNDIQIFAAVGTLRPSSLQIGQGMLYRLTDPDTGRTVAYIRTTDVKYGQYLGQFVGVRGAITNDPQLKFMIENPIEVKAVDESKVNQSVAAQIVPASLMKFEAPPVIPSTQPAASSVQASTGEPQ